MVLLINEQSHTSLSQIEKLLKTEFVSKDYMLGFLEGYLFDQFKVLTLFEYETRLNSYSPSLQNKWVKFLTIKEKSLD